MTESPKFDEGLLDMLKRAFLPDRDQILPRDEANSVPDVVEPQIDVVAHVSPPGRPPGPAPIDAMEPRQPGKTVSPAEVQDLILTALTAVPNAPNQGMSVTVYGYHPWNAMVTFAPGSTNYATAKAIYEILPSVVEHLRKEIKIEISKF